VADAKIKAGKAMVQYDNMAHEYYEERYDNRAFLF